MSEASAAGAGPPIRVARVISRLNIGGPAIQAITLTERLESLGYRTTLIRGREGPDEGSMDYLARELGVRPVRVPSLRRDPGLHDLRALWALVRALRQMRPQIVHTHAAKAGTLGRLAALLAFRPGTRPVLVHTFHGHSLSGYFSSHRNAAYRRMERLLASRTTRLIAISDEVRDELVALGVAGPEKFDTVPVGFDLSRFLVGGTDRAERRSALRAELGIPQDATVVTLVARLVPIKRVDRFLRIASLLEDDPRLHFLIVGDGELRDALQSSSEARHLATRVAWAGFTRSMPAVFFASDVVVQTSDNEGTPVSLIEAQAAGVPVASTRVGGVTSVIRDGETGRLVPVNDELAMAQAIRGIVADAAHATNMAARGREHVLSAFSLERLVGDIDALYGRSLQAASHNRPSPSASRR